MKPERYNKHTWQGVPKLTDVFRPIALLAQRDVDWNWGSAQEKAVTKVKQLITEAPTLAYFNPTKQLVIQSDAINLGIGAALLQDDRPIANASRALTDTGTRYIVCHRVGYVCNRVCTREVAPVRVWTLCGCEQ